MEKNLKNFLINSLIDTHCHINIMLNQDFKSYKFDKLINTEDYIKAKKIIEEAEDNNIKKIINVGTSLIESYNCIELAKRFNNIYAAIGIHPTDLTQNWKQDIQEIKKLVKEKEKNKIIAIGECGIDKYRIGYDLQRQKDGFANQIEIALNNNLAIIVHTRNAPEETLTILQQFKDELLCGVIHCFSEDLEFAKEAINLGFMIGLGGTITYPKNNILRDVAKTVNLKNIVLETDAPFLPPQIIRGQQNHPKYIKYIAQFLSELRQISFDEIATQTTENVIKIFKF